MGFLSLFDRLRKPSGPSASSGDRSPWGDFFFESASARSGSGMRVSADGALRLAAVYACVRILSETMASLPLVIYQRRPDGGKDRVTDHWLYRLMGNRPRVADRHYLAMTDTIRAEGAAFIGEVLTDTLRGRDSGQSAAQNTPVGRCKDPLHGDKAPGDGQRLCDQFVNCLGCRSYAIVGSLPDLHRLYSFQGFLMAEIGYFPPGDEYDDWRAHRQRLIELIDRFTLQYFSAALISQAKALAESEPHRFWALQIQAMERAGGNHAI